MLKFFVQEARKPCGAQMGFAWSSRPHVWPQLLWHGERHDKMLHAEQLARLLGQPVLGLLALAVWAVLIATNQLLRNKTGLTEKKPANLNAILLLTRSFPDKISEIVDLLTPAFLASVAWVIPRASIRCLSIS